MRGLIHMRFVCQHEGFKFAQSSIGKTAFTLQHLFREKNRHAILHAEKAVLGWNIPLRAITDRPWFISAPDIESSFHLKRPCPPPYFGVP